MTAARTLATALTIAAFSAGCPLVDNGSSGSTIPPILPSASLQSVALTERPSYESLGAFYCHDFAAGNVLLEVGCTGFFGNAPRKADLRFGFTTTFQLDNENDFPIPVLEMLLALDVFEGAQANLGAICVSFCEDPESGECAQPEVPCEMPDTEINGVEDFVPTINDLIGVVVGAINGEDPLSALNNNLGFRFIPANGSTQTAVRFELDLDSMIDLIGELVGQSSDELLAGQTPTFDIPFKAEGSLFFDLPVLGRSAIGYGPMEGAWSLD